VSRPFSNPDSGEPIRARKQKRYKIKERVGEWKRNDIGKTERGETEKRDFG